MAESTQLLEGLGQWDFHEAHLQTFTLGEANNVSSSQLIELLDRVPIVVDRYSETCAVAIGNEAFTSKQFEGLIWTLGESLRRLLRRNKALRRLPELWIRIEAICRNPLFGRGRESFTMLLGQYGGHDRVPCLVQLLEDAQVQGHALYALRLLGAAQARVKAEELVDSPRAWIRTEARKYLRKVVK